MEKFIGREKVLTVADNEQVTPAGSEMVTVTFESGVVEVMPKKRFELIVSDESVDETAKHEILKKKVSEILYSVMIEYGLKMGEINSVTDGMTDLVNNGLRKASNILFGSEYLNLSLIRVNKVLLEDATKESAKTE